MCVSVSDVSTGGGASGSGRAEQGGAAGAGPMCEWTGRLEELGHHCRSSCQYETVSLVFDVLFPPKMEGRRRRVDDMRAIVFFYRPSRVLGVGVCRAWV